MTARPTKASSAQILEGISSATFYKRLLNTSSDSKCHGHAKTFAHDKNWHVPTLIRAATSLVTDDAFYRSDPNLIDVSKATRASWEQAALRYSQTKDAATAATLRAYLTQLQSLARLLKGNNVQMLAGSDGGIGGAWVIPRFSLHQEFRLLAENGLSPLDVLQMTTLKGAVFLGR